MKIDLILLENILIQYHNSSEIKEFDLLKKIFPDNNEIFKSNISLFKFHFNLYHHLFKLQDILKNKNYYLFISAYKIKLFSPENQDCVFYNYEKNKFCKNKKSDNSSFCKAHQKYEYSIENLSLKEFYLDKNNLNIITENILDKILQGFWKYYENRNDLEKYYNILDLKITANKNEIKNKFRQLALKHHPDKTSGNHTKFKKINQAYQILKICVPE